jgi:cell division protein FtsB
MSGRLNFESPVDQVTIPKCRKRTSTGRSTVRLILLATIVFVLAYLYIGGNYGWFNMWQLKQGKSQLEEEISRLEARKLDLTSDLDLLKKGPREDARYRFEIERLAREKHGMVREDELIYRFSTQEDSTGAIKP